MSDNDKPSGISISISISETVAASAAATAREAVQVWGDRERGALEIGRTFLGGLLDLGRSALEIERTRAAGRSAADLSRATQGRPRLGD